MMNNEQLFEAIARDLQHTPGSASRVLRVLPSVMANNKRVARAARELLGPEDHPDTFDAWCRSFAQGGAA